MARQYDAVGRRVQDVAGFRVSVIAPVIFFAYRFLCFLRGPIHGLRTSFRAQSCDIERAGTTRKEKVVVAISGRRRPPPSPLPPQVFVEIGDWRPLFPTRTGEEIGDIGAARFNIYAKELETASRLSTQDPRVELAERDLPIICTTNRSRRESNH